MCKAGTVKNRKGFITARLVYYTFVEPFDLEDPEWCVRHKDGNGFNCLPNNLYLFERHKFAQWRMEHNRVKLMPPVSKLWQKGIDSMNYSPMIQPIGVAKYSLSGDLTDAYHSILVCCIRLRL